MGLNRVAALTALPERQAMLLQLVGAGFSMLAILLLARGFGATMAGHYAVFSQTVLFAGVAAIFGHDQALTRAISGAVAHGQTGQARAALRHYGWRVAAGVAIAAVIAALASVHLGGVDFPPVPIWYLPLAIAAYAVLRMTTAGLRGTMHLRLAQVILTLQPLALLCLFAGAYLHLAQGGFQPLAQSYLLSLILAAAIGAGWLVRTVRCWPPTQAESFVSRAPDSYSIGLSGLIIAFTSWAEIAALGLWADAAAAGVFRVCVQLLQPFLLAYAALAFSVGPLYSRMLAQQEYAAVWAQYRADRRLLMRLVGLGGLGVILFSQPILAFLGEEFRTGFWPLAIMAGALLLNLYTATAGVMLTMAHREDVYLRLTLCGLAISILCIVLLVPQYGMIGAAISVAMGVTIREGGSCIAARRIIPGPHLTDGTHQE